MAKILAQVLCTVALLLVNSRLRTSTCRLGANYLVRIALVRLSELIPWEDLETEYADGFSLELGAPAKPFQMALGALIIKERLGSSDAETVEQIRENPYLQYFLGLSEYTNQAPFDASMLVHFRKRLSLEIVGHINERIVLKALASSSKTGTETTNERYFKKENEEGRLMFLTIRDN